MMLDFQQKRKIRAIAYHNVTLVILFLLVLVVLNSTWKVYLKKRESELEKNNSISQVEDLRIRSDDLKNKIDRLNTPQGMEEEIRSKFSVVKGNETMVIVVPDPGEGQSASTSLPGFWSKLKGFFGQN